MESQSPVVLSHGSLGHPALCRAPCVHIIKNGYCEKGFECDFCHLPHGRKVRLNKSQREALKLLGPGQKLAIIVPFIMKKVSHIEDQQADVLLKLLQNSLPEEIVTDDPLMKQLRLVNLHRAFQQMSVTALLDLLSSCLPSEILAAYEDLRKDQLDVADQMIFCL
ncbi:unnamed protein product [Durusdinium trenchii]|uniref:C3H1-type domain-containing protein n=1 Tax=Durusdinium trenchii TaxID=1381693 RepID=A0ABP0T1M9_9DINO